MIVETLSPGSELNWQLPIFLIGLVAVFISINSFRQSLTGHITMQIPVISYSMMSVLLVVGLIELGVLVGISPGAPHGYLIIGLLWFVAHAGYFFVSTLFWAQANKDDI